MITQSVMYAYVGPFAAFVSPCNRALALASAHSSSPKEEEFSLAVLELHRKGVFGVDHKSVVFQWRGHKINEECAPGSH